MDEYILEAKGISKRFGGVKALNSVDFALRKGTVHALMGENGAGKSTLMKILLGYYVPDSGDIFIDGKKVQFRVTSDALRSGISMIYQELNPVPYMTVADNIFLGREPLNGLNLVDYKEMWKRTEEIFKSIEIDLSPRDLVANLSVAQVQLVEIAKAISYNSEILVMDEPTSALSDKEIKHLFEVVRRLNKKGVSIVYISHKLDEIYEICEDVTILRDGELIRADQLKNVSEKDLVSMMVGQEVEQLFPWQKNEIGETVLEVNNLTRTGEFENISFNLKKGEILGVAGLVGAGRTEMVETIYGMRCPESGNIRLHNRVIKIRHPKDAIKNKIVMVSEDRKNHGLVLLESISHNVVMSAMDKTIKYFLIDRKLERKSVGTMVKKLQIKAHSPDQKAMSLSGGNQQKVVVAKILYADPEIIILDEPTRGIDVKTKSEIHSLMSKFASEGKAVLMVSSELPEILGMSDRIIVMSQGKIAGELSRQEATAEKVLTMSMKNVK